jgi:alcohol dehydrogenase class IV
LKSSVTPDFNLPTEIFIRQDIINNIAEILKQYGSRAILIMTSNDIEIFHEKALAVASNLKRAGIGCIIYDELPEYPNTEDIDTAVSFAKKTNCNMIIGFGGIEALNSAKAISLLINNFLFCDSLFSEPEISENPVAMITMPAFPVFGFEIAPLLFLDDIHEGVKKVYHNEILFPKATIVDPSLSLLVEESCIMKNTVASLAIATESVISRANNDIINTFALKSIDMIFRNLPITFKEPQNPGPRLYLSTASVMSGIAFSVAFLSVTLATSLALASKTALDLESAMGIILPHIMEFNLTSAPGKYVQMSKVMGEDVRDITVIEAAIKAVEAIRKLETDIDIPQRLSHFEVMKSEFKNIAETAMKYPFLKNTPRPLNLDEIETILIAAF